VRGKIKTGKTALILLTMLVSSVLAAFAVPNALAPPVGNTLIVDTIENPLLAPGDTFTATVAISNVDPIWKIDVTLNYDTSVLTALDWSYNPCLYSAYLGFTNTSISDINDAAGYIRMGAFANPSRGAFALGKGNGIRTAWSTPYPLIIPGSDKIRLTMSALLSPYVPDWLGYGDDSSTEFYTANTPITPGTDLTYAYVGWDTALEYLGEGDGERTEFQLLHTPVMPREWYFQFGGDMIYVDGVFQYDENNLVRLYTIDFETGVVKLNSPPIPGAIVEAEYSYLIPYTIDYSTGQILFDSAPTSDASVYAEYEQNIPYTINYTTGLVTFASPPGVNVGVFVDNINFQWNWKSDKFALVRVKFKVDSRGECALTLSDTSLWNKYGASVTHTCVNGLFNNKYQGYMYAPTIKDEALVLDSFFDVFITVDDVRHLHGYQFTLVYDPAVLDAQKIESLNIFTEEWKNMTTHTEPAAPPGIAVAAFSSWLGDPEGLSVLPGDYTPVAKVTFKVLNYGWSKLELIDTELANVLGDRLVHVTTDGSFANVDVLELAGQRLRVEHRIFDQSDETALGEDLNCTLKTPIKCGHGLADPLAPVTFKVVFKVYIDGGYRGEVVSGTCTMAAGETLTVITLFDTTLDIWKPLPYSVYVEAQIEYDLNGDGVTDGVGGPIGPFDFFVRA